jgi:Ca2+-binding RTX toxin-like protein
MKINIQQQSSVAFILGVLSSLALAGCASEPVSQSGTPSGNSSPVGAGLTDPNVVQTSDALGVEIPGAFNSTTKVLTIDMTKSRGPGWDDNGTPTVTSDDTLVSVQNVALAVVNGALTVNGFTLPLGTAGAELKPADVKGIVILGTNVNGDKVVLDALGGALGAATLAYTGSNLTGGISIDFLGKTGEVALRGTPAADAWKAGQNGDDVFFEMTGDKKPDVVVEGTSGIAIKYTVALSGGNDTFTAMAFGPLTPAVAGITPALDAVANKATTFTPMAEAVLVYGGEGNDTIAGGLGDDSLYGGAGLDIFKSGTQVELTKVSASDDGTDLMWGGAGVDKVDYTGRTLPLIIALDGDSTTTDLDGGTAGGYDAAADGTAEEGDLFGDDIEDITGGDGNDTLTGNALANKLVAGKGDDVLVMGAKGTCTAPSGPSDPPQDVDSYDGGDGDDTFDRGTASGCGDILTGGIGTDLADYSGRTTDIQIALSGTAISGEVTDATVAVPATVEKDNIKVDVEDADGSTTDPNRMVGSSVNNVLTGGGVVDYIDGGAGDDTLNGHAGVDTMLGAAGNDTMNGDAGNDVISGGDGNDTLAGGDDDDAVDGGAGNDSLAGDGDNDLLNGGAGNDALAGGDGDDYVNGDLGDDVFDEGSATNGADVINGGGGHDKLNYSGRSNDLTVTLCTSTVLTNNSSAVPAGACATADDGEGSETDNVINVKHLVGGTGADDFTGTDGDDIMEGGADADTLDGGIGNDKLYGDDGDDTVTGGAGEDHLEGGADDDTLDAGDGDDACLTDTDDLTPAVACEL